MLPMERNFSFSFFVKKKNRQELVVEAGAYRGDYGEAYSRIKKGYRTIRAGGIKQGTRLLLAREGTRDGLGKDRTPRPEKKLKFS